MFDFLFVPHKRLKPTLAVPTVKTDLKALPPDTNLLIWPGHSSCFIRLGGKTILIDPVFSSHASPFVFSTRAFAGSNAYTPDDMPEIDYLILSHDHWDHLDHPTLTALKPKVRNIICGLGVGEHLERWGFPPERVQEADWFDTLKPEQDFSLHVVPARHFSGRGLFRDRTLWGGYVLETPELRIFYSGDTGYGSHLAEIGKRFDGFLTSRFSRTASTTRTGSTSTWSPNRPPRPPKNCGPRRCCPFIPACSPFPIIRGTIREASRDKMYRLATPKIGEVLFLDAEDQVFAPWWEDLE